MAREQPPVITVIGLGPVGLAIGQALTRIRTDYRLVGHDRDHDRVKAALAAGAIDEGRWNLVAAVEDADLVFITEPVALAVETIGRIAPHVRPGALVTDTAPVMRPLLEAAKALPEGVSFVSGHPVLGGAIQTDAGPFVGVTYGIVPAANADAAAVRVLVDLIGAIGAEPYFIDAAEHDALAAAVDQLPHLAGAALARVLGRSPSAADLARLMPPAMRATWFAAGRESADAAAAAGVDPAATLAWLDGLLRELTEARARIAAAAAGDDGDDSDDGTLTAWLTEADDARAALAGASRAARGGGEGAAGDPWAEVEAVNPLRSLLLGRRKRP